MKRIIIFIVAILMFTFPVFADETDEVYDELYRGSEIAELDGSIDSKARDILGDLGLDLSDYNSFLNIDADSYINVVLSFIKSGLKKPFSAMALGFGVIIICSAFGGMLGSKLQVSDTYNYICTLSLLAVVLTPLMNAISAGISAIKSVGVFMLSFIPIYSGLIIASGGVATGTIYQSVMLIFCELITEGLAFIISPLISAYVCIGVASSVSSIDGAYMIALRIKSVANWLIGFIMTLFSGFLSIQSIVSRAADSITIKTARFFVGSFVPVVGTALGEALTTVTAGVGLLKATAMSWCIVVLVIILLPLVVELLLWRVVMFILSSLAITLNIPDSARLFDTVSAGVGFLVGIMLSVAVMFILSLVIVKVGAS